MSLVINVFGQTVVTIFIYDKFNFTVVLILADLFKLRHEVFELAILRFDNNLADSNYFFDLCELWLRNNNTDGHKIVRKNTDKLFRVL